MRRRKGIVLTVVGLLVLAVIAAGVFLYAPHRTVEVEPPPKPEAPPDLAKLRASYIAGINALGNGNAAEAVKQLGSFSFGIRAVEQYRLYYLANAYEARSDRIAQRATLARLWRRNPRFIYRDQSAAKLAGIYAGGGDWASAAGIDRGTDNAASRWHLVQCAFYRGDVATMLESARTIAVRHPRAPEAAPAIAALRSLSSDDEDAPLVLTAQERLDRAIGLSRDGDPEAALEELTALESAAPASLSAQIRLNRGLALFKLHRHADSNAVLEPLAAGYYRYAVPAIFHASKNYRTLAASIDPTVLKTVKEKKKVGTVKVRVGKGKQRKLVTRPKYATVSRTVKLIDLAKKQKKDEYERLASERLKDLLSLPLTDPVRLEVLNTLIEIALTKNQDSYVRELVQSVVKIDPQSDPALQHFWDKAWATYLRGDLAGSGELFRFIADTYASPGVRRQNEYWFARTAERRGAKEEAAAIYRQLAAAPYDDLYALHARARGAPAAKRPPNPLKNSTRDWQEIAEASMPPELRLAYELTALSATRDARLEIMKNMTPTNDKFAQALMAEIYASSGNPVLMYRAIRRAWPQLATVEQDTVPPYFIRLYYPMRYEEDIRKNAAKQGLDPYIVMALILQESYYNPKARSRVGATGLMQIMPPTGNELARRLYGPLAIARLEDPETNIALGTLHLKHLYSIFGGNTYFAVASYNAGQGNVLRWRRTSGRKPTDEFLESIPFPETRNYVKRVTMLRSAYERLHQ